MPRSGLLYGIAAYGLWGLFPLYFGLLDEAGALEVLAHRIAWSLVFVAAMLAVVRRLHVVRELLGERRRLLLLSAAALLVATNWGVYLYAVMSDRVIDAALGYFITPLVSVGFGLLVFGERLRRVQAFAVGLGILAVVVLTTAADGVPWIPLTLAFSWGSYGLVKKVADVGAAEGLGVETLVLVLPALAYLALTDGTFATEGTGHALLLAGSGIVTAIPLLLFSACVTRTPLSTVGLLQYLTPVLQFLIGWAVLGELMPLSRWIGFTLVWTALVVLTADGLRATRAGSRAPPEGVHVSPEWPDPRAGSEGMEQRR